VFTGSATQTLIDHLSKSLQLGSHFAFHRIQGRFDRKELVFVFRPMHSFHVDIINAIEQLLQKPWEDAGSMIIYVRGPKETDQVRNALADLWINDPAKKDWMQSVEIVSSPMSDTHRDEVVAHLNAGLLRVVIATVCLGMVSLIVSSFSLRYCSK
jgi:superfamily II DNA helicase RecQ